MLKPLDIPAILKSLARQHPIFHSEADFRLQLALYLRETYPYLYPVFEYPLHPASKEAYDMMMLQGRKEVMALELKYFCQAFRGKVRGEMFELKWNAAADGGRYAALKDVQRLEKFLEHNPMQRADFIAVTNDYHFWRGPKSSNTNDAAFNIKDGLTGVTGRLKWAEKTSPKTKRAYKQIYLQGSYDMHWQDYSKIEEENIIEGTHKKFRFLHIPVQR